MSRPFGVVQMRAWYNTALDEDVLVVRTSTFQGRIINKRTKHAMNFYDPRRHLPVTEDTIIGISRMHLVDRHTPAAT